MLGINVDSLVGLGCSPSCVGGGPACSGSLVSTVSYHRTDNSDRAYYPLLLSEEALCKM